MSNATDRIVGIRLRKPNGRKLSVKGGREGLFIPTDLLPGGRLLIAEGPTDTAALLDLGLQAVGRPSCTGGTRHVIELVKRLVSPDVVVVADADTPGRCGAERLAATLAAYAPAVRVITPSVGIKDARAWVHAGATAADVQEVIDAAPPLRLEITSRTRTKGRN